MQTNYDVIRLNETEALALADSPYAEKIKNRLNVSSVDKAESEFSEVIKLISDADLRERIDAAVGRISFAYEKLGFVQGYVAARGISINA